jgi:uncharacterized protein YndB with AHSA1/START domain
MTKERQFTLTWTLDAPAADVFRAWTDPAHLDWFYNDAQPKPAEPIELDLRVGGVWRQQMVIDEEIAYPTGGVYREIVPDERLVFAWGAEGGWPALDPQRLDQSPQVTVTFDQTGEQTTLTLQVHIPASYPDDGVPGWWEYAPNGWRDTVGRLVADLSYLPTENAH